MAVFAVVHLHLTNIRGTPIAIVIIAMSIVAILVITVLVEGEDMRLMCMQGGGWQGGG